MVYKVFRITGGALLIILPFITEPKNQFYYLVTPITFCIGIFYVYSALKESFYDKH